LRKTKSQFLTKRIKVLHISSPFTWRGGEQQLMYLHQGLLAAGHTSLVFCPNDSVLATRLDIKERVVYNKRSGFDFFAAKQLAAYCKANKVDLVHAHDAHSHTTAVLGATLFRNRCPIMLSRRVDFPIGGSWFSRYKYNHRQVKTILCVSDLIREMVSPKITASHIEVATVHSGVDLSKFVGIKPLDLRDELNLSNDAKLVANFSALADHKDYFTFIDTAKIVCNARDDVYFLIFGKGELEDELRSYANQSGYAQRIVFVGFRNDLPQVYPNIDVLLFTSKTEGLGTTVLDAFASKVPVVATQAGGIPEMVIDGETGLLAKIGDASTLAINVQRVLDEPNLQHRLTEAALQKCQTFSKDVMVRQTEESYNKVLNN
jgi:L-malate glycosyltransferase